MDVKELLGKVAENLSVGRSFGPAYERDGTTFIPVALVAGGGGGGGGEGPMTSPSVEGSDESATPPHHSKFVTGAGGGFGGVVIPLGAYAIKEDRVRWIPVVSVTVVLMAMVCVIRMVTRSLTRINS